MNFAVKFWKDMPNRPLGMPHLWPAEVREIMDAVDYDAEEGPWVVMSRSDYDEYVKTAKVLKDYYDETYLQDGTKIPHKKWSPTGVWLRVVNLFYGDQPPTDLIPPEVLEWHDE